MTAETKIAQGKMTLLQLAGRLRTGGHAYITLHATGLLENKLSVNKGEPHNTQAATQ